MRGDAFVDSCGLQVCLLALRRHVRPEGVLSFRSCGHSLTVFVMSLIILITIRIGRPVLIKKMSTVHLQTPLTLIHHLQPMSVDFVAKEQMSNAHREANHVSNILVLEHPENQGRTMNSSDLLNVELHNDNLKMINQA